MNFVCNAGAGLPVGGSSCSRSASARTLPGAGAVRSGRLFGGDQEQRREEVGFTAAAAGRAIGIIQAYVSGVEAGKVKLPASRLAQIVEAYELEPTMQSLMDGRSESRQT
ncbi:helix-turn-helix domain-containing protein [Micromonospora sp. NPDC001898]|uniref:helix-turn-helix domain-containing protein n=1 Tax=Micromonospora sp. NPDC001898 TaxID=3364221 RepID=UPI003677828E